MGSESPNVILYDVNGQEMSVSNGSAIPAGTSALMIAGSDGTNSRFITLDTSGRTVAVGAGTAGTPAGGVVSIQGVASGTVVPVGGTLTANIGTTNGLALDTSVNGILVAQASTTSGQTGPLIQGAVTTSAPSYSTGKTDPLSLTTAGALRVDGSAVTQPVSGTVTANAGSGNFAVVQATAANLNATVIGTTAIGDAVSGNPVMIGAANPSGVAGYIQLSSDDSLYVSDGPNTQPVMINATVNSNSQSNLLGIGDGTVYLFINVKNAPTGTSPTLTFTMQEVDPGDKATVLRSSIVGKAITAIGTQVIALPMVSSGVVQVSWTIGGTASPTFTGVYVTAICKNAVTPPDVYGDLYHTAINATVFEATTSTAGVTHGTTIGTAGAFTLYNPKTSTKNLVVLEMRMSYVSGTLGSGTVYLCANTNPAAAAVTGTSITPAPTLIGSSATAQGTAFTSSTLPAAPTVVKPIWTLTPMLATSVFQPFELSDQTEGKYVILPGCSLSLEAVAGAGTAPKVVFSMSWVEVPF
jgi:hypothetical protein